MSLSHNAAAPAAARPQHASPAPAVQSPDGTASDDSLVQSWKGDAIADLLGAAELGHLYRRWMMQAETQLPRLNEFLGQDSQKMLNGAMMLLQVPHDFLFLYQGAESIKIIGRNFTGSLHSEQKHAVGVAIRTVYEAVITTGQPHYLRYVANFSEQHFCIESLVLPIAGDERRSSNLLLAYSAALDDKIDVLKAIFDHSLIGMIAALPSRSAKGDVSGGQILMINPRARSILKLPQSLEKVRTVNDLGPWFRNGALWTRTSVIVAGRQTHLHYRDRGSNASYRVTIEPLDRFMLFSIVEVPL
ncbi:MAG: hypothetical protein HY056_12820 [Proteobacteria bacterium]|nr:hypothetical protein [Pseudomonadota bacterium]